eukprot:Gb_36337 [translate_table: standard]
MPRAMMKNWYSIWVLLVFVVSCNGRSIEGLNAIRHLHKFGTDLNPHMVMKNWISNAGLDNSRFINSAKANSLILLGQAPNSSGQNKVESCRNVSKHEGYPDSCSFVKAHESCQSVSILLDYTLFFYCSCRDEAWGGYLGLAIWIGVLFYLLASTASEYFCWSVEKLCGILGLSPAVAGASLLALGNGAPDMFSSIAAFVSGTGNVGVSSVLGGALFVSTVVAGLVSICASASIATAFVQIDGNFFVRNVGFFLVSLLALLLILADEKVYLWEASAFLSIYIVYGVTVAVAEFRQQQWRRIEIKTSDQQPLLEPLIITCMEREEWWSSEEQKKKKRWRCSSILQMAWKYGIEWPLMVPRRLTIPVTEEDRWSRFYAVSSATLAPILMANMLCENKVWQVMGICSGVVLGSIAFFTTNSDHPPRTFMLPWVAGGFVMSIVWFYMVAGELVAEMVSLGVIFDINPTVLSITVLAWGNSVGDLVSDVSLATCKAPTGVQTAVSGCYAGPMFNTLVGIGASMVLATATSYPHPLFLPYDPTTIYTVAFLTAALLCVPPSPLVDDNIHITYSSTFNVPQVQHLFYDPENCAIMIKEVGE